MVVREGAMDPRPGDKLFKESPMCGHPSCVCSRCGEKIMAGETAIRLFTTNTKGEVDENSQEYRYCEFCMSGVRFFNCQREFEFGSRCKKQCDECKEGKNKDLWE